MENYSTSQQQPMEQQQQEHQHKSQLKWDLDTVINIAKMFDIVSFHDLLMYYSIDKIDNLFSRENKLCHRYNDDYYCSNIDINSISIGFFLEYVTKMDNIVMSFSASSLSSSSSLNTCSDGRLDLEDIFKMAISMLQQQFKTVGEDNNITINNNSNSNNNNTIGNNMNHSVVYELAHELYGLTQLEEIYDHFTE